MTEIPILPPSSPFTPEQRAWLNGFFAGLLGVEEVTALPAPAAAASPAPPAVAPAIALAVSPAIALAEEDFPWHDSSLPMAKRLKLAEGKPFERVLMAAMAQLDCGACGYLCKTYAEAIAGGTEKSLKLCSPGGAETAKKLKELLATSEPSAAARPASAAAESSGPSPAPTLHGRKNPFAARLLRCERLNRSGSEKDTRLVALSLEGSGLAYEPGDSLGVWPRNPPETVESILTALGATGDEPVASNGSGEQCGAADRRSSPRRSLFGRGSPAPAGGCEVRPEAERVSARTGGSGEIPMREALLAHCDLRRPADSFIELLRASQSDEDVDGREVLDLLEMFPGARPAPREFIAALDVLQPRLYSIASSPRVHRGEVHLTVAVVRYESRGRKREGVASTFLADRVGPGESVPVFIHAARDFRLPADGAAPVIMIGPGTGIAPFRAFLHDRKETGARGKNWLFFGDQRESLDFLYREELEEMLRGGTLTRLDTAFSRDQKEKIYVQHRLLENAREVWRWLDDGASVYVCGDAKRMAKDVDAALQGIAAKEGGLGAERAREYWQELAKKKRYLRDVY